MATLQHNNSDGRNSWAIKAYVGKKRVSIGLGDVDQHAAETAKAMVEHLIERTGAGKLPDTKVFRWLDSIDIGLHDRLSKHGLCTPRRVVERPTTILAFFRSYIADRTDWKKPANYSQAVDWLEKFLRGRDVTMSAFTKGDGERWHRWMLAQGLSANTAGQNVKRCRQMLWSAVSDEMIAKNPMEGIKVSSASDASKDFYVDLETYQKVLKECPCTQWRVILALSRIGGLRCPSEVLALSWSDINWSKGRVKVTSSKTAKAGKGSRLIPLFPELREELQKLHDEVGPGIEVSLDSPVVTLRRATEANLRTQLIRIIEAAGMEAWQKPFMAMRSSRRTELERSGKHPNHVLNAWLGHSKDIAAKHYLKVLDADFEAAISVVPLVVPSSRDQEPPQATTDTQKANKKRSEKDRAGSGSAERYTQLDSNK